MICSSCGDPVDQHHILCPTAPARSPWRWLASTHELQTKVYGYDYGAMADDPLALSSYLQWNTFAAMVELAEVSVEFSWKPWAMDAPFVNRERVLEECVDVLHFVGNKLTAIGVTDEELEAHYKAKQEKNRARQASGTYSAKKGGLGDGSDA